MVDINWQNPPAAKDTGRHGWRREVVAKLRERPGQWALVEQGANSGVTQQWKHFGCEAVARDARMVEGYKSLRADIYARWPE